MTGDRYRVLRGGQRLSALPGLFLLLPLAASLRRERVCGLRRVSLVECRCKIPIWPGACSGRDVFWCEQYCPPVTDVNNTRIKKRSVHSWRNVDQCHMRADFV